MRDLERTQETFEALAVVDPYRLNHVDVYSNVLYVLDKTAELSHLAHHVCKVDAYRPESCCVVGNYYSIKQQHSKAVLYFKRALKLNQRYLSAWTLIGHEYLELKNTPAAISSYRRAVGTFAVKGTEESTNVVLNLFKAFTCMR
eukprot:m.152387 g.152387  ORF g.152387 m.152387 type:complete len:144 (+) comp14260_c0_seq7:428-859(+)